MKKWGWEELKGVVIKKFNFFCFFCVFILWFWFLACIFAIFCNPIHTLRRFYTAYNSTTSTQQHSSESRQLVQTSWNDVRLTEQPAISRLNERGVLVCYRNHGESVDVASLPLCRFSCLATISERKMAIVKTKRTRPLARIRAERRCRSSLQWGIFTTRSCTDQLFCVVFAAGLL